MKVIKHNEIDFCKWDQAILNSPLPLVFAQSFYLNATSPGWEALIEGDYETVMPLTVNKKLGLKYLIQPPFTPQLGIYGKHIEKVAPDFFKYIQQQYKYINVELNALNDISGKPKRTFIIDFKTEKNYNSNTKRNIGKAEKLLLQVETLPDNVSAKISEEYLNPFLKNKLKLPVSHVRLFNNLLANAIQEKKLKTFVIKSREEELVAIAHFVSNGKHAVYLKGTNFDRNSGSMHLLMHHAIEFYKMQKVKLFDFGGGQSDSMAQFYAGFGAEPLIYKTFKFNKLPLPVRWLKK